MTADETNELLLRLRTREVEAMERQNLLAEVVIQRQTEIMLCASNRHLWATNYTEMRKIRYAASNIRPRYCARHGCGQKRFRGM